MFARFCAIIPAIAFAVLPALADTVPGFDTSEGTKLADGQGYVTLVRLQHQPHKSDNGRVLIAFERPYRGGVPIYESRDDGDTFTPLATVTDQALKVPGRCELHWQPNLIEMPRDAGSLKKGTLMFSANATCADKADQPAEEHLQVYISTDVGHTWQYRSTIVEGPGRPSDKDNHGVWEPFIVPLSDGRLVVYYSSEQHKADGYNQLLAHKVSSNGGATWSTEVYDSAVPGGLERPGMATVMALPDRRYAYTYEDIDGPGHDGEASGQVYIKYSRDGLDWGDPADRGTPIATMGGAWPVACPMLSWLPIGGPKGILIVSAQRAGGAGDAGGRSLYFNKDLGRGPWWQVSAPVQKRTGNMGAGWTQALMLKRDGRILHMTSSSSASSATDNQDSAKNIILYAAEKLSFDRYEAEDAARHDAAFIRDNAMSNRARVRIAAKTGHIDYNIYVDQAGRYPVTLRYAAATLMPATPKLSVNGAALEPLKTAATDNWSEVTVTVPLTAGYNTISVIGGQQPADIDYIELGAPTHE
jgi:hypothetical protein